MTRRLLLWDIDGTLVRVGAIGADAFDRAIVDVTARTPAGRPRMSGKTDPQIVGEYLVAMGIPDDEPTVAAVLAALAERLASRRGDLTESGTVCPGVPDLLARLDGDDRILNGVLTGNIAPNAVVKLEAFGLDRWLDLEAGAYGSDHADRTALVPIAMDRVAEHHGVHLDPADVWVIGDTPADLACARAGGVRCLLVATGRYGLDELTPLDADATLADLADTDAVIGLLTADL